MLGQKACSKCKRILPISQFSRQAAGKDGLRANCRACDAAYYQETKERQRVRRLEKRRSDPKMVSDVHRKERYGAEVGQFDDLLAAHNRCCGICGKGHDDLAKGLHVDHNHETGKVRGLLCVTCNAHLGRYGRRKGFDAESAEWLTRGAKE